MAFTAVVVLVVETGTIPVLLAPDYGSRGDPYPHLHFSTVAHLTALQVPLPTRFLDFDYLQSMLDSTKQFESQFHTALIKPFALRQETQVGVCRSVGARSRNNLSFVDRH